MIEIAEQYKTYDLAVLPCNSNKSPAIKKWKGVTIDPKEFENKEAIGIICGEWSKGIECLDFDNHFGDAKNTITEFFANDTIKAINDNHKLVVQSTQSGGYHVIYRANNVGGSTKLASKPRKNDKGVWKPDAIIETRGQNAYFVCSPSIGYKVLRGSFDAIPTITNEERNEFINVAKSFNEWIEPSNRQEIKPNDNKKPSDYYNEDSNSIEETKDLLRFEGWKINGKHCTRPDKKKGISATYGKVADNVFYVFSSNCYPFEENKGYTPFQLLALLKYNGDFKECAKELYIRYDIDNTDYQESKPKPKEEIKEEEKKEVKETLIDTFIGRIIDLNEEIIEEPPILSVLDPDGYTAVHKAVFTLDNFSAINGKAKAKKTFFLSLLISASVKNDIVQNKIYSNLPVNRQNIIWFDTEQSKKHVQRVGKRVIRLAGSDKSNFSISNLRGLDADTMCKIIEAVIEKTYKYTSLYVIDGIADLAYENNDEKEARRVVDLLLRWTQDFNIHICTVIHQNKGDNYATGHIGSQIMKKAETVISVARDENDKTKSTVSCDYSRDEAFEDFSFHVTDGLPKVIGAEEDLLT